MLEAKGPDSFADAYGPWRNDTHANNAKLATAAEVVITRARMRNVANRSPLKRLERNMRSPRGANDELKIVGVRSYSKVLASILPNGRK